MIIYKDTKLIREECSKVEVLDFVMDYESYPRKRRISVSSRRYKPTGKHRHLLRQCGFSRNVVDVFSFH
jgi:hypothetical protein